MNIKVIIIILVIVIAGGAAAYYLTTINQEPSTNTNGLSEQNQPSQTGVEGVLQEDPSPIELTEEAVVYYTDEGFSPETLTIKPNTMVTFFNESSSQLWTASGVHPAHQLLPSFDHKMGIKNGEYYQYTFYESGTWPYHNHLQPGDVGKIIVE